MGFGTGALFVSGFVGALREAMYILTKIEAKYSFAMFNFFPYGRHSFRGFPDNLSTYGMVSGLWMASFSLGSFVGPSVSIVILWKI